MYDKFNQLYNAIIYTHPDTGEVIREVYFSRAQYDNDKIERKGTLFDEDTSQKESNEERARRRAKKQLKNYALANDDLELFITLTVDPRKCDRTDYNAIYKKLGKWLNNQVTRKGLKYIIVPEYHKDGKGIHFHGIINKVLPLRDSGRTTHKQQVIYNLSNWTLGFTTAIKIDKNRLKCFNYITKYITKSREKIGGRWYLSSANLKSLNIKREYVEYDQIKAKEIITNGVKIKIIEGSKNNDRK